MTRASHVPSAAFAAALALAVSAGAAAGAGDDPTCVATVQQAALH
jgi:hypothetical protein